ncbi:hypothetical protein [Sorangium sp. So ce1151]|uniref:hypothetical protein n=1 Tax=Sorangium sp. So ce1151 TaxID=3133332 RepID=UPI003F5F6AA2
MRAAAAEAFSGDEAAAPRIRELLDEPSAAVRAAALMALARDAGSVERIAATLDEPSDMDGDPAQLAAARVITGRPELAGQLRAIVERGDYAAEVTRAPRSSSPGNALSTRSARGVAWRPIICSSCPMHASEPWRREPFRRRSPEMAGTSW